MVFHSFFNAVHRMKRKNEINTKANNANDKLNRRRTINMNININIK